MPEAVEEPQQKVDWSEFEPVDHPAQAVDWSQFEEVPGEAGKPTVAPLPSITGKLPTQEQQSLAEAQQLESESIVGGGLARVGRMLKGGLADVTGGNLENIKTAFTRPLTAPLPIESTMENIKTPAISLPYKAAGGVIETVPQLAAIEIAGPEGVAALTPAVFGATPEGFDPKQAAIATALPGAGKYGGELFGAFAKRLGVSGTRAINLFKQAGGLGAAAAYQGIINESEIAQLPPEQREKARIDAIANLMGQSLLGPMGVKKEAYKPGEVAAMALSRMAREAKLHQSAIAFDEAKPLEERIVPRTPEGTTVTPSGPAAPPGPSAEGVRFVQGGFPKRAQPVGVPGTPAEPGRGVNVLEEIRRAGADTTRKVQQLFPERNLSRQEAAELRRQAFAETGKESYAGKDQEAATVYGDMRTQPEPGAREVPTEERGPGVLPQAEGRVQGAPGEVLLSHAQEVADLPVDKPFPRDKFHTEDAHRFGAGIKTKEQAQALLAMAKKAQTELRAVPKSLENIEKINTAGMKLHWLNEALEAMTGIGGDKAKLTFIRQAVGHDYAPPFPEYEAQRAALKKAPGEEGAEPTAEEAEAPAPPVEPKSAKVTAIEQVLTNLKAAFDRDKARLGENAIIQKQRQQQIAKWQERLEREQGVAPTEAEAAEEPSEEEQIAQYEREIEGLEARLNQHVEAGRLTPGTVERMQERAERDKVTFEDYIARLKTLLGKMGEAEPGETQVTHKAPETVAKPPAAAPPTEKEYPVANEHGVYSKNDPLVVKATYPGKKATAQIHVVETPDGWIYSAAFNHKQGTYEGQSGPLSDSGPVFPTEAEARNAGAEDIIRGQQSVLRSRDGTPKQKEEAENIIKWAWKHMTPEAQHAAASRARKERPPGEHPPIIFPPAKEPHPATTGPTTAENVSREEIGDRPGGETAAPQVLNAGNVDTTADIAAAHDATPPGEPPKWTPKIAKEQKKFLFDAIDQAIAEAPSEAPETGHGDELLALANVRAFATGEDKAQFEARREAVLNPLFEKYGIPEGYPATEEQPSLDPEHPLTKAEPAGTYSIEGRAELLREAIERAKFRAAPKVTIEVPGDGTFDIIHSKAALKTFKEEHAPRFPTSGPPKDKPYAPRAAHPTQPAPIGNLEKASILKALDPIRSTDESRYIINFLWSDGKRTVATDGRRMTIINKGIGGTEKNPKIFKTDGTEAPKKDTKDKYPNWQQPIPGEQKHSVPNVDTAHLFSLLKQAEQTTSEKSNSIKLWLNKDGSLGMSSIAPKVGSYSNNVNPDESQVIAAFNPEYFYELLNAARRVGDEKVTLTYDDELSPLKIVGNNSMSVLMPMRLSFGGGKGGIFGGWMRNSRKNVVATTPAQVQQVQAAHTPGLGTRIIQGIKSLLLPSAKSAAHLTEAERLGSMLGPMHQRQEATATQLRQASREFDRMGVHDETLSPAKNPGIQFMSDMSQGRAMVPKLEAIADKIRTEFRQRLAALAKAGAPLESVRKNYFPGMWTRESREAFNAALDEAIKSGKLPAQLDVNTASPAQRAAIKARVDELLKAGQGSDKDMMAFFTKRPLKGRETFRKEKVFDDIMDAAEFGLRPISNNPVDLVKGKLAEMDRSIMANQEFQSLKNAGKLKIVNPYEDVPANWVRVNDKYGTIYGPPTTKVQEHIDKTVYQGLLNFAKSLGIEHRRLMKFPPGPGQRALGLSFQGGNLILSRFGTETSVISHELGHQLDVRYDLWNTIYKNATGIGKKGKITKAASEAARVQIGKDLRAIADLTGARGGDPRSRPEKIAQMVEAYAHAPDMMKKHAPLLFEHFDKFIKGRPELAKLATIKPGIELMTLESEKYVGLPIVGYRVVPKEVGDILNNYLSSSLYNNQYFGPLYKGWMEAANTLNQAQLGLGSAFHAGFTTLDAQISANADLLKDVYGMFQGNRTGQDVAKSAGRAATASVRTAVTGDRVLNAWRNPDGVIDPRIAQVVKAAELAGGGFRLEHGLQTEQAAKAYRDWFSGHRVRAALRTPLATMELMAKPIMEYLVPRQKAGVFAELAWRIIEQNPGKGLEDLTPQFRQAWNRVDARLGQVRYDRLFANNTAKGVIQALVRAPGWSGGTIAEIGGAVPDAAAYMKEFAKTGKAPPNLPDRVAYTLSLLGTVMSANAILTYALSGKQPEGLDYMAFWDGTYDEHGNKRRWLLPSYMKDLLAYAIHPGQTAINKLHPALSVIDDVVFKNKDYYGYEIRDPHAGALTQAGQAGKYVLKSFVPFWIRGAQQASKQGATVGELAGPYVGVMPAPRYVTMTPMQRQISDLYHQRTGEGTKPYERQFTPQKKRDLLTSDIYQFQRLPDSDKKALRARMTPQERSRYH